MDATGGSCNCWPLELVQAGWLLVTAPDCCRLDVRSDSTCCSCCSLVLAPCKQQRQHVDVVCKVQLLPCFERLKPGIPEGGEGCQAGHSFMDLVVHKETQCMKAGC